MTAAVRILLLQVRDYHDPMRIQEVECFARALDCEIDRVRTLDLLSEGLSLPALRRVDVVLIGGSGDYSVVAGGPWLSWALDAMRLLYDHAKPTFASCWGFQALARALGGEVVTDLSRAELGTHQLHLTTAGCLDPVFGIVEDAFPAQFGHQDIVDRLPPDATLLASTRGVANQAFRFQNKPIYATQFHPELTRSALLQRVECYPEYVQAIAGVTFEEFATAVEETPGAMRLLPRFVQHVFAES
ncbi:MAG: aminotransferase [Planctomycetaceae bacterium]|nr:aminotransferase [Planctomycetaceae bacterium]